MSTNNQGIIAIFDVPGMTANQYDQVMQNLESAGQALLRGDLTTWLRPKMGAGWLWICGSQGNYWLNLPKR